MALVWESLYDNTDITTETFVNNLRVNIDEDTEDLITNPQILNFLKEALVDISSKTNLNPCVANSACNGAAYYELPDGITALGSIYYLDVNGNPRLLRKGTQSMALSFGHSPASTTAQFWSRQGNRLYIYGNPSNGSIQVWGSKEPTVPAAIDSSTYIDLPKQFIHLCYKYVEWMYWRRAREADQVLIARDTYNSAIQDAIFKVQKEYGKGVVMYGQRT